MKSPEYLALNPQGKMPLLVLACGAAIPESDTISRYLLDEFESDGPSFDPGSPLLRARSTLAARILDIYITPHQGCLYKEMSAEERSKGIREIAFQLDVLENVLLSGDDEQGSGARVCGSKQSLADSALFPTLCFLVDLLPAVYNWTLDDVFKNRPKLRAHWLEMSERDAVGKRVVAEMREGLKGWMDGGRFENLGITAQVKADPKAFLV